jgi:hypothetical protein
MKTIETNKNMYKMVDTIFLCKRLKKASKDILRSMLGACMRWTYQRAIDHAWTEEKVSSCTTRSGPLCQA